ncbi:MAG: hypothetical protein AAF757_18890, partial [Cyanobacteria bacterium P01_D01_bin.116]
MQLNYIILNTSQYCSDYIETPEGKSRETGSRGEGEKELLLRHRAPLSTSAPQPRLLTRSNLSNTLS